jgi:hypothetical protein
MYLGKHPYEALISGESEFAFFKELEEHGIQMEYASGDEELKLLVDALTQYKASERPGHDGLMLWLKDSSEFEIKFSSARLSPDDGRWKNPFRFEDIECWTSGELASEMSSHWVKAKEYLYRGLVKNFFSFDQTIQNRIESITNDEPTARNTDYGMAQFLHYLEKGGPFHWAGQTYKSLNDIAARQKKNLEEKHQIDREIARMIQSGYLSWKYDLELARPEIARERKSDLQKDLPFIKELEKLAQKHPEMACYWAMLQWNQDIQLDLVTPDEMFASLAKTVNNFYEEAIKLQNDDYLMGQLAFLGYVKAVIAFKESVGGYPAAKVERAYTLFETVCKNKSAVRAHHCKFGPESHLFWLKNNLGLYTFRTEEARKMKAKIERIALNENMDLNQQRDSFRQLNGFFNAERGRPGDFMVLFQDDFIIASLGLTKGLGRKGEITATHADAFFLETFMGKTVPIGYAKFINKGSIKEKH